MLSQFPSSHRRSGRPPISGDHRVGSGYPAPVPAEGPAYRRVCNWQGLLQLHASGFFNLPGNAHQVALMPARLADPARWRRRNRYGFLRRSVVLDTCLALGLRRPRVEHPGPAIWLRARSPAGRGLNPICLMRHSALSPASGRMPSLRFSPMRTTLTAPDDVPSLTN